MKPVCIQTIYFDTVLGAADHRTTSSSDRGEYYYFYRFILNL